MMSVVSGRVRHETGTDWNGGTHTGRLVVVVVWVLQSIFTLKNPVSEFLSLKLGYLRTKSQTREAVV